MSNLCENIQKLNSELESSTPKSLEEIENKIQNAQTNGFIGKIPNFILENLPNDSSAEDFLIIFNDFVKLLKKDLIKEAQSFINDFFQKNLILKIQKNLYKGMHIDFGVIIENSLNSKKFFLKVFKENYKQINIFHYRHGPYVEPAVAQFINAHLKNTNNFVKFYFANSFNLYMLFEYVESVYNHSKDFLEKKEETLKIKNLTATQSSEIFADFMEKITGENFNHYKILQSMTNGHFRHLDYQPENFIICKDEKGHLHCKMIDYGYIISYKNQSFNG